MWDQQGNEDQGRGTWRPAYFALVSLDKLLSGYPSLAAMPETEAVWPELPKGLLLHPHAWIRSSACRVLGQCFSSMGSPEDIWQATGKKKATKRYALPPRLPWSSSCAVCWREASGVRAAVQ